MIAGFLVWTRGLRGFVAHKEPVGFQPSHDARPAVDRHELGPDEYRMTIAILEQRYPCRAKLEDEPKQKLERADG